MMFCYFLYQKNEISEYNPVCKLPKLKRLNDYKTLPGIIYFMKLYNKYYILKIKIEMDCFQKEDWGYLANNTWYFITNIEQKLENYICEYRSIQRKKDDFDYEEGKWLNLNHAMLIKDEVFEVLCKNKRKIRMNKNNTIDYQGKQIFYIKIKQIY